LSCNNLKSPGSPLPFSFSRWVCGRGILTESSFIDNIHKITVLDLGTDFVFTLLPGLSAAFPLSERSVLIETLLSPRFPLPFSTPSSHPARLKISQEELRTDIIAFGSVEILISQRSDVVIRRELCHIAPTLSQFDPRNSPSREIGRDPDVICKDTALRNGNQFWKVREEVSSVQCTAESFENVHSIVTILRER
jgi:hypothetical protein